MGDTLKSIPIFGAPATAFGLADMTDNHANRVRGSTLTCAGAVPVMLDEDAWFNLHMSIARPHNRAALMQHRTDGEIPILGNLESPLKAKCDELRTMGRLRNNLPKSHR